MRSDLEDFKQEVINARTKRSETIRGEFLRSRQEVEIANYLYLNNINYEYEPIYPYNVLQSRKPYTPDFKIVQDDKVAYLEHFGISENGENDRYSTDELNRYKKAINDKPMSTRPRRMMVSWSPATMPSSMMLAMTNGCKSSTASSRSIRNKATPIRNEYGIV